uniref:GTP-binding protein 6 n=1 Tax=Piliocolobus tephrosceles TaxID=591936 RepID=A0A8C9HJW5_9PRIM
MSRCGSGVLPPSDSYLEDLRGTESYLGTNAGWGCVLRGHCLKDRRRPPWAGVDGGPGPTPKGSISQGGLCVPAAEWQVAEATALVHTLDGWSVVQTMVVSTKSPDRKLVFGKGNFQHLTEKIRGSPDITCVFLNVERMAAPTKKELEAAWGVEVFDRFTVVLHIFRCNARTKEARLQVALAEIPLHRSNLKRDVAHLHRGAGSRYIMGSGESFMQVQQRLLREKEAKIQKALDRLRKKRHLLRQQRTRREFPVVSVVGYTNCGEPRREDWPREGVPLVSVWGAPAAARTYPGEGLPVVSLVGYSRAMVRTPSTPSSYPEHYHPVHITSFPPSTPSSCLYSHHYPVYTTTPSTVYLFYTTASPRLHRPPVYTITSRVYTILLSTPSPLPRLYHHPVYTVHPSTPQRSLHLHRPPVYTITSPLFTLSSCLHHHPCPIYTTVPSTQSTRLHHSIPFVYTILPLTPSPLPRLYHHPMYTVHLSTPSPPFRLHRPPSHSSTTTPSLPSHHLRHCQIYTDDPTPIHTFSHTPSTAPAPLCPHSGPAASA